MMMSFLVLSLAFLASIYSVESAAIGVRLYSNYARAICSTICSIGCTLALDTMTVPPAHAAISKDSMSRWTDALEELKSLDTKYVFLHVISSIPLFPSLFFPLIPP